MILCVGLQHVAPVDEFPADKWDKMIALNLSASFHTTRLSVSEMKERGDNASKVTSTDTITYFKIFVCLSLVSCTKITQHFPLHRKDNQQ